MKSLRATGVFILVLATAVPLAASVAETAHASALAPAPDACTITTDDAAAIATAAAQGLSAELAARRALLTRVIGCAIADAQTLKANLNAASVQGGAAQNIQSQLSGQLDDAVTYYNLELGKVAQAGIGGTQGIARETLSWRSGNYDPLAARVSNFMLWAKNQALFDTAGDRLGQMKGVVSFIEQAAPNPELEADIASAESLIVAANSENMQAEQAQSQALPPDQVLALIQQSLQSLSDAYQKFSDISATVQTLLPTNTATPAS